jgi:nucleoside-diphosphate-sugar epimerase
LERDEVVDRKTLTIGVIGANGFVGARAVEYFILSTPWRVRAIVRSFHKLVRIAELPQERLVFARADALDEVSLEAALRGCDLVLNCAYGSEGAADLRWRTIVGGTQTLLEVMRRLGIERLIHLSTAAIHDTTHRDELSEATPLIQFEEGSYEHAKWLSEELISCSDVAAIVLRPTVIYGPWGKDWTSRVLERLRCSESSLPQPACAGISNTVFIDDVAHAIVLAIRSRASGPFLIASDEEVTWGVFYAAFRELIGQRCSERGAPLEAWEERLYSQRAKACLNRSREMLEYQSSVPFSEGMARVRAWHQWMSREQ